MKIVLFEAGGTEKTFEAVDRVLLFFEGKDVIEIQLPDVECGKKSCEKRGGKSGEGTQPTNASCGLPFCFE